MYPYWPKKISVVNNRPSPKLSILTPALWLSGITVRISYYSFYQTVIILAESMHIQYGLVFVWFQM